MNLDVSTELWMLGVIIFGVVFYAIAMRYANHYDDDDN